MELRKSAHHGISPRVALLCMWLFVFLAGLFLYALTAQHGVGWQDSGMLQWRILAGDYTGDLGLALAHPLYIAFARLFLLLPVGSEFFRLSLCSGAGMAVTLANLAVVIWLLTGQRWIGLMAAGMLSVMHTPWWLSTVTEVYTWNTAFFTAELIVLIACIRRPSLVTVCGLFLLTGLNISVHNLALLSLPVYGTVVLVLVCRRRIPYVTIPFAAIACLCGALPLLWLAGREALGTGDVGAAVASMLFSGYSGQVFNLSPNWPLMGVNAALSSLNFMHAGLVFALVGWVYMSRAVGRQTAWTLYALLGLQGLFFLRYSVPDQFTFILPTLVLICLGMAIGMDLLANRSVAWRRGVVAACLGSIALMPFTYAILPPVLEVMNINVTRDRVLPFRDEVRYWIKPWKHTEDSAERFARAALQEAAPDGMIVCDGTSYYPLALMQDRMQGVERVAFEYHGSMSQRFGTDPVALEQTLLEHTIFIISPALNFMDEEYRQGFRLTREPGSIVYRLSPDRSGVQRDMLIESDES